MTGTCSIVSNCVIIVGITVMRKQCATFLAVRYASAVLLTLKESNNMTLVQSNSFASYGSADSLLADGDTIRQFIGRSSLTAIDTLATMFLRTSTWKPNRIGNDFTQSTTVAEFQLRKELV